MLEWRYQAMRSLKCFRIREGDPVAMASSPFLKAVRTMRRIRCHGEPDGLGRPVGGGAVSVVFLLVPVSRTMSLVVTLPCSWMCSMCTHGCQFGASVLMSLGSGGARGNTLLCSVRPHFPTNCTERRNSSREVNRRVVRMRLSARSRLEWVDFEKDNCGDRGDQERMQLPR